MFNWGLDVNDDGDLFRPESWDFVLRALYRYAVSQPMLACVPHISVGFVVLIPREAFLLTCNVNFFFFFLADLRMYVVGC